MRNRASSGSSKNSCSKLRLSAATHPGSAVIRRNSNSCDGSGPMRSPREEIRSPREDDGATLGGALPKERRVSTPRGKEYTFADTRVCLAQEELYPVGGKTAEKDSGEDGGTRCRVGVDSPLSPPELAPAAAAVYGSPSAAANARKQQTQLDALQKQMERLDGMVTELLRRSDARDGDTAGLVSSCATSDKGSAQPSPAQLTNESLAPKWE